MSQQTIKRSMKESRKLLNRHFKRGDITRVTIVQDQAGKVVLVSTSYERAQAAMGRSGLNDAPLQMRDFEVEP